MTSGVRRAPATTARAILAQETASRTTGSRTALTRTMVFLLVGLLVATVTVRPIEAAEPEAPSDRRGDLTPNQLTDGRTLTPEEALAACGPAAAVALARAHGRAVTLDAAVAVARNVGWSAEHGMAGPASLVILLKHLGVSATIEAGVDSARLVREVRAGRPVVIRTIGERGHYLVAERYDAANNSFDFGQSAIVLKRAAGRRWFSLAEISSLGLGTPTHTISLGSAPVETRVAAMTHTQSAQLVAAATTRSATSTPVPSSRPSTAASPRWVVDTGGSGARLRAEPSTDADVVASMPDGSHLVEQGEAVRASGRLWRRVIFSGRAAWIDASLLQPA